MSDLVRITDVSPRDGLQNEPLRADGSAIPARDKLELIRRLAMAGVDEIEVTSFVSPKWVPQLGDGAEVVRGAASLVARESALWPGQPEFSVLIPNLKGLEGLEAADESGCEAAGIDPPMIRKIGLFTAASEAFAKKNTNATIAETIERFREVMARASVNASVVRGYISCVVACPFEGEVSAAKVGEVAAMLVDLGVSEIDLGDTIGAGTPETIARMLAAVSKRVGAGWFRRKAVTLHLHDTRGTAASCVEEALRFGVRSFDGAVGGLGGCPYASTPGKRAPGNIATETLVRTVHAAGYETMVDEEALAEAGAFARSLVGRGGEERSDDGALS
ncbi:MAG: hydroxymethylglutaryl-CoA lyase [Phycisphaerales bacterium]